MTYKEKREQVLRKHLDPLLSDEHFKQVLEFVEKEINSAFGRGVRHARQHPASSARRAAGIAMASERSAFLPPAMR